MELPHLGKNCDLKECNRLDFLPVKCDACSKTFCIEHYKYDKHNCEKCLNRDVQVPVCPLCSDPVVGKRTELPDVAMSQHIDQYCKRNELMRKDQIKQKQSNLQACSYKTCKQKDLIYLECKDCRSKFCIKHRHPTDHLCSGSTIKNNLVDNWNSFKGSCSTSAVSGYDKIMNKAQQISKSGQAALNRLASTGDKRNNNNIITNTGPANNSNALGNLQGNISEQEALAIAIQESTSQQNSKNNPKKPALQVQEDEALARAIQESMLDSNRNQNGLKDNCMVI